MNLQEQRRLRKKQRTKIMVLVILALITGFVAGVCCTIAFTDKYSIIITKPNEEKIKPESDEPKTESEFSGEVETEEIEDKKIFAKAKIIAIDAGHQKNGNFSQEPIAPGATQTKAKTSGGTTGVATKIPEYQVNLEVALLLEEELISRGYEVIMIRRSNDVDISNSQRAMVANDANADAFIRIHCNGAENSNAKGALTLCQTSENPYCGNLYDQSRSLSEFVVDGLCEETGAANLGVTETDTMSGINWCQVPVTIVEMGFMTNYEEDILLCDTSYQKKLAIGIANGIDDFFA